MEVPAGTRDLAGLAVRLLAVCMGLGAVVQLGALAAAYFASLLPGWRDIDVQWMIVAHWISLLLWTLCAAVLWLGADWLARRLAPEQAPLVLAVDLTSLRATAFAIVGVVWFGFAATSLAGVAARTALLSPGERLEVEVWGETAAAGVQLVLSVALLLGARRVSELLRALRKSHRADPARPPEPPT